MLFCSWLRKPRYSKLPALASTKHCCFAGPERRTVSQQHSPQTLAKLCTGERARETLHSGRINNNRDQHLRAKSGPVFIRGLLTGRERGSLPDIDGLQMFNNNISTDNQANMDLNNRQGKILINYAVYTEYRCLNHRHQWCQLGNQHDGIAVFWSPLY